MYRKLNKILENCDAIIINSPHNLRYFSGFSGGEGILLITKEERFLFTDSRYTEAAENEARDFSVKEGMLLSKDSDGKFRYEKEETERVKNELFKKQNDLFIN